MNTPVSYQDASDILVDKYRQDLFAVHAVLKHLFNNGFLDEVKLNTREPTIGILS